MEFEVVEFSICMSSALTFWGTREDMIYTELRKVETPKSKELDPDLPGLGQFYCLHCE